MHTFDSMLNRTQKFLLIGWGLGTLLGYVYYKMFPCEGSCTVTSSPIITCVMGAMIGGFVFQFIHLFSNKKNG